MKPENAAPALPNSLKRQLKKALSDWVASLPSRDAETKSIYVSGVGYTPLQILKEAEEETSFGMDFLEGLRTLNEQMVQRDPKSSIFDLIARSVRRVPS